MPRNPFVPPGGFAGFAQMTSAVQALLRPGTQRKKTGKRPASKKRAKKKVAKKQPARKKRAKKASGKRLVKGSPAAKRRMAQLRKMRGKKR